MRNIFGMLQLCFLLLFPMGLLFSQDAAGQQTADDFITLDSGIYISPQGSDYAEGNREKPFRSLKKALDYMKISGKKVIYADSGRYFVDSTLKVAFDVEILGSAFWKQDNKEGGAVIIESWEPAANGDAMFSVHNAKLTLKGIDIKDVHRHFTDILRVTQGTLSCEKVTIEYSSAYNSSAVHISDGTLKMADTIINANGPNRSIALKGIHSTMVLARMEINGGRGSDEFSAVAGTSGSTITAESLTIKPGHGGKLTGIIIEKGNLSLRDTTLQTGVSSRESVCILGKNSKVSLSHNTFIADENPYKVKAVSVFASKLEISSCKFILSALSGVQGVYAYQGEITMRDSYLSAGKALEYYYCVQLEQTTGKGCNNIIVGGESTDCVNLMLTDSASRWINNTVIGGNGSNLTAGIFIRGSVYPLLINNIISRKEPADGTALYIVSNEEKPFYLLANNISGWEVYLQYANIPGKKNYTAITTTIKTIEELNHYDLVPFGGTVDININEAYDDTFESGGQNTLYQLRPSSRCVDAGIDVNTQQFQGPSTDYAGNPRPNPKGAKAIYDIGAFELSDK